MESLGGFLFIPCSLVPLSFFYFSDASDVMMVAGVKSRCSVTSSVFLGK